MNQQQYLHQDKAGQFVIDIFMPVVENLK